jgi:hypothetical protein
LSVEWLVGLASPREICTWRIVVITCMS